MYIVDWQVVLSLASLILCVNGKEIRNCTNVSVEIVPLLKSPSCSKLAEKYRSSLISTQDNIGADDASVTERSVSIDEEAVLVALVWGSDPSRAAAALFRVLVTHALYYRNVHLACGPHSTTDLATAVPFDSSKYYETLIIGLSTAWQNDAKVQRPWFPMMGSSCGLAGPRLEEFGRSPVTARCRLHGRLTATARTLPACKQHVRWTFYSNTSAQQQCDFIDSAHTEVQVLVMGDCRVALAQLEARVTATKLPLQIRYEDRATLLLNMQTANYSFLFLDHDIWQDEENISIVESPPCPSVNFSCSQDIDTSIAMRVADVKLLELYAYHILLFAYNFKPSSKSLRAILEKETTGVNIEEAACQWALNNTKELVNWNLDQYNKYSYWIAVFLCREDPYQNSYVQLLKTYVKRMPVHDRGMTYNLMIKRIFYSCSNAEDLNFNILARKSFLDIGGLVGVVAQITEKVDVKSAARAAAELHVPLLMLGLAPTAPGAWRVSGTPRHLTLALQHFIRDSQWNRIAVLSQMDPLADEFLTTLQDGAKFSIGDFKIPLNLIMADAAQTLQKLKRVNARIIFVNADEKAAALILTAALELSMRYEEGYVWIVRDRQGITTHNMTHFTVSFWRRSRAGIANDTDLLYNKCSKCLPKTQWPPLTTSLVDALFIQAYGFYELFTKYAKRRLDLQTVETNRLQNEQFIKKPITGLTQVLRLKEGSVEETFVFLDKWRGIKSERLMTWQVNISANTVRALRGKYFVPTDLPRYDGATTCIIKSGDPFEPHCHDTASFSILMLSLLVLAAILLSYRLIRRHIEKLVTMRELELMEQRQHVATILSAYKVSRESLEIREEIGAGRFGCVRLAVLRAPSAAPCFVAAKALREGAAPSEESEFLREARIIASLDHVHIVRLVGVCIDSGPPLILMELAFFGDLLRYLSARRYLVEGASVNEDDEEVGPCEEASHVSSEALTRLGREAASALAYVNERGLVHRDLRAANCLVDARRSLKLADFGMARETKASADGAAEYACRRRGFFPVLWMAPESLKNGLFSAASDVWALGVLLLELVTLGARPYGNMPPLRVMQYVEDGGCPPLPLDASSHTRGVARLCWKREPERRPTAAEVASFLAANPRALRPALHATPHIKEIAREVHHDADSGLGVSPSTELLPPDWPLDSISSIQLDNNYSHDANYYRSRSVSENQRSFEDIPLKM